VLAIDCGAVIEELDNVAAATQGPGWPATFSQRWANSTPWCPRIHQLAASLPDAPLAQFQAKVKDLPTSTEAERLVVQRIG
jgi:hypothetical protein